MEPENFEGLIVRPIQEPDFSKGLFSLLQVQGDQNPIKSLILSRLSNPNEFAYIVAENPETQQIVGLASVFIEYKFFRSGSKTAHLEKILLSDPCNSNLFNKLINILKSFSQSQGAYKILATPDQSLTELYQSSGFTVHGIHMELVFS